ncbi:S41 family peptidase [Flaviaesturariibacter amylovorans]|uniref:S41 family peptidase n=1 Tax=Flaviaesturariibacter amylovorans TaxID=1084520 RepID=A0ABP8G8P0_9BACT
MKHLCFLLLVLASLTARAQWPNTLSPADKLYGLSKFWQEVNYNFAYLNKVDRNAWDSAYKALLVSIPGTKNDYDYYRELQRFCALLKDGHTNVYMPPMSGPENFTSMFGAWRFFLENIGGKAIVVRTALSKKDELPVGSELVEVNGLPTQEYKDRFVKPYISSSTDYVLEDWATAGLLAGYAGDQYKVTFRRPDGSMLRLDLTHARSTETAVFPAFDADRALLDFRWLPNKVPYVSLNSFSDPKIDSLFEALLPELYSAKGLIIDLRYNGGGSTGIGTDILRYLTPDSVLYGARYASRLHVPAFKAWGKYTKPADTAGNSWNRRALLSYQDNYWHHFDYEPTPIRLQAKRLVVPTMLLTGHQTASAAEDFLIHADNQKHMVRIGAPTFGSTGQPYQFDLPGGGSARVCTKQDTYPDGRAFVGYGIQPHVAVSRSINDYLTKRDPVLEKAQELLGRKIR